MSTWWLSLWVSPLLGGTALAGAEPVGGDGGVLRSCVKDPICAQTVGEKGADALRDAAASAEGLAVGLSPAVVRGTGFGLELSAQSLALPGAFAPGGVDVAPAIPRLAMGGFAGRRLRVGGGVQGGLAAPTGSVDLGFALGARGGFALGSPEERRWVGLELDAGYGTVQGDLFEDRTRAASSLAEREIAVPRCPAPCVDVVNLLHVGVDSTFTFDVDAMTVVFGRLGGVWQSQTFDVGVDGSRWGSSGILPRVTLGAAYRPQPHALLSGAVRLGMLEDNAQPGSRLLWLASVAMGWRFGPDAPVAKPIPPPVVVAPAPVTPLIVVPKIPVTEHPELECGDDRIPTGTPPPLGLEGWCVRIDEMGHVAPDGPYVRWHDAEHVAVRGENKQGSPTGIWTELDLSGALLSHGAYVDGLKEGLWRTYYPSGSPRVEATYHRGLLSGHWEEWTEDGSGVTEGEHWNGVRDGLWRDFKDGQLVRQREYRDGNLVTDDRSVLPE